MSQISFGDLSHCCSTVWSNPPLKIFEFDQLLIYMLNQAVISFNPDRQTAEKLNLESNFMLDSVYYSTWWRGITPDDIDLMRKEGHYGRTVSKYGLTVQKNEDSNIDNAKKMLFCILLEYFRSFDDCTSRYHQSSASTAQSY